MIYSLNSDIVKHEDCDIYAEGDNKAYYHDGELHVEDGKRHFVGKPDKGWYMIGQKDGAECYQGKGACPVVKLTDPVIITQSVFDEVMTEKVIEKGKKKGTDEA